MWIVWRPGWPDPSRLSPAVHYADPKLDRNASKYLRAAPIAREHQGMSIHQLLSVEAYNMPAQSSACIDGDVTKSIEGRL